MNDDRIKILTGKLLGGTILAAEKKELADWVNANPDDQRLSDILEHAWDGFETSSTMPEATSERILSAIFPEIAEIPDGDDADTPDGNSWLWKRAIAAVLIVGFGFWWWTGHSGKSRSAGVNTPKQALADIAPGGNKAVLTLGDGSSIVLDSAGNGTLASQGGTDIRKSGTGELVYEAGQAARSEPVFNTVSTPKGGQYHIVLPDGTGVWLNAASSMRFPTFFTGKERKVEITGEVYFEVARNEALPFVVTASGSEIRVLGTHFNVMAYADEKVMRTTLLEGAVKVSRGSSSALLAPGQQARIAQLSGNLRVLDNVDTEKELSWKNGFFQFENESLESIMRQVSRWYDVEVRYEGNASAENFTGRLPRNSNVSKLLKILALSGVKFRIEDKTIIVTP